MNIYASVDTWRYGLGNMLMIWARAEAFCLAHGATMLGVPWVKLMRVGPWLRREKDKRYYLRQFTSEGCIRGLRKTFLLATGHKISEYDFDAESPALARQGVRNLIVTFQHLRYGFRPFQQHLDHLRGRLQAMLNPRLAARIRAPWGRFIGVHVRKGDFVKLPPGQPIPYGKWNYQVPDEWYLRSIQGVQSALGEDVPVVLFSNGKAEELECYGEVRNLIRAPANPAIVDILLLSQSAVLVASGSSFSCWAEYLGQVPSVWYPAGWKSALLREHPELECETDREGNLPASFVDALRAMAPRESWLQEYVASGDAGSQDQARASGRHFGRRRDDPREV